MSSEAPEPVNVAEVIRFHYPVSIGDRIRMTTIDQEITCVVTDIQPVQGVDPALAEALKARKR